MSSSRHASRHARARGARFLPSPSVSGVARNAAKSLAGVGIVLGSGAFIIAPSSAVGAGSTADVSSLTATSDSVGALFAERDASKQSSSRSARTTASAAVTAPAAKGADADLDTGALGIEAVAKPKPKPKPVEKPEPKESTAPESKAPESKAQAPTAQPSSAPEPTTQASPAGVPPSSTTKSPRATPPEQDAAPPATAAPTRSGSSSSGSSSSGSSVETSNYGSQGAAIGLGSNAQKVYSAVRTQFPGMSNIGGYRAGDAGDHGAGRAVDIMTGSGDGDALAAWLQQHAVELDITYVIWKQRIWMPGGSWTSMEDRGDPTQNHFDHVHVSVN